MSGAMTTFSAGAATQGNEALSVLISVWMSATLPDRPPLRLVREPHSIAPADPDPGDFDAVFRRFAPYVARVGTRLLGADGEVDDLVQEVFIEAHRGLSGVREPKALRGWLARIAVRRATRRLRRRRLLVLLSLQSIPEAALPFDASLGPEHAAEVAALCRRLDRMAAEERVAWILKHVEGESLDDIAVLCGCSKSTVQRRLRGAAAHFEPPEAP
jgi:RNA polymerase sigma-70 factor (ECF subfamily)